jgi:hypothetical protein
MMMDMMRSVSDEVRSMSCLHKDSPRTLLELCEDMRCVRATEEGSSGSNNSKHYSQSLEEGGTGRQARGGLSHLHQ